jgi:hypothetical protein
MSPSTPTPQNSYQVDPGFPATDGGMAPDVYLLPPSFQYQAPTQVSVANVYLPPAPLVVPANPPYAEDFTLTWNAPSTGTKPTTANVTLTITIENANQWKTDAASRAALRAHFALLAAALDDMELTDRSLAPGATQLVLRRVAEMLPAPLAESLFYYHGLSTGLGTAGACPYVDLLPGTRLVAQPQASQFTAPGAKPQNGPTAGGHLALDLHGVTGGDGLRRVAFDAFLGSIAAPLIPATPLSSTAPQVIAGGALDLQAAGTARRWYRLLYPLGLPDADSAGGGGLLESVTLAGAETRADLEAATVAFQSGRAASAAGATPLLYWVLRGRTVLVPQVTVFVNGGPRWVALGTTVRHVVEPYASSNPYAWDAGSHTNLQVTVSRPLTPNGQSLPQPPRQPIAFNVEQTPLSDPRVYELPLVQGDVLTVTIPGL